MNIITKTIQGQEVEFLEAGGKWAYRLVNATGWHGKVTRPVFNSQEQAEGRAKRFIDQYYLSKSND